MISSLIPGRRRRSASGSAPAVATRTNTMKLETMTTGMDTASLRSVNASTSLASMPPPAPHADAGDGHAGRSGRRGPDAPVHRVPEERLRGGVVGDVGVPVLIGEHSRRLLEQREIGEVLPEQFVELVELLGPLVLVEDRPHLLDGCVELRAVVLPEVRVAVGGEDLLRTLHRERRADPGEDEQVEVTGCADLPDGVGGAEV